MLIMSSNVWLRSSLIFLILYFSVSRSSSIWQTIKKNFEQERKWQLAHRQKSDWQQWSRSHMSKTHLINPDVEPLDVHLSLLASVFAHLQLVPEVSRDVENTWGNKQPLLLLAHLQFIHKVNRCLARYSPRATTTNRPTNRALNKPAWPGQNWPKMPILGKKSFFLLEKSKVLLPT